MDALGTHLLLELGKCDKAILDDIDYIQDAMINAAAEAGANIIGKSFHKFDPRGVTGIVVISESHLCIHTWPEHGYAAADIFTCGKGLNPEKATDLIIERLRCFSPTIKRLTRGPVPEATTGAI